MSIKALTLTVLITTLLFFSGCGPSLRKESRSHKGTVKNVNLKKSNKVRKHLYDQHAQWRGVSYRIGGLSKIGIDCSGFVYMTFKTKFNINLPRTTKEQAKLGKGVGRRNLKAGDLVFFKTKRKVRHVGIYIEDGKFLHASTSKGVMISNLNDKYWKKAFWKARRIKR